MKRRCLLMFLMLIWLTGEVTSQVAQVLNASHPLWSVDQIIRKKFAGTGVEILEVSLEGDPRAVGLFTSGAEPVGLTSGLILSTGIVDSAFNGNTTGNLSTKTSGQAIQDTALAKLLVSNDPQVLKDGINVIIRFLPQAPRLSFRYVFASEEYPEFICGEFNDVFGFFIRGPRPGGGQYTDENIARVPTDGSVVSVNSVHPGKPELPGCVSQHAELFNTQAFGATPAFNAFLDVFSAELEVIPCMEYTIKLALADVVDDIYDTAVLLEANTFSASNYSVEINTPGQTNSLREGCAAAEFIVKRTSNLVSADDFVIRFAGQALIGLDYTIQGPLTFTSGADSFSFKVVPVGDQIGENAEDIAVIIPQSTCWNDTVWIRLFDPLPFYFPSDTALCLGQSLKIDLQADNYYYEMTNVKELDSSGVTTSGITVPVLAWSRIWPGLLDRVCLSIAHPNPAALDVFLQDPTGKVIRLYHHPTASGSSLQQTCFSYSSTNSITTGTAPYSGDFAPEETWLHLYTANHTLVNGVWELIIVDRSVVKSQGTLEHWSLTFRHPNQAQVVITPGLVCVPCDTLEWRPASSDTYNWSIQDILGCDQSGEINVDVTELSAFQVECTNQPNRFVLSWADGLSASLAYSIDGLDWDEVPRGTNYLSLPHLLAPGQVLPIYFRFTSPCGIILDTIDCVVQDCLIPSLRMDRISGISCAGQDDGSITLSSSENVRFWVNGLWSDRQTFNGLPAGDYIALAENTKGCRATLTFTINEPLPLSAEINIIRNIRCYGIVDGEAFLRVSQSQGPVIALWDNGEAGFNPRRLHAGINAVTVTDQRGCTAEFITRLDSPSVIQASVQITSPQCGSLASINLTTSGGSSPYRYMWPHDSNNSSSTATELSDGVYHFIITDRNGCLIEDSAIIDAGMTFQVMAVKEDISCAGFQDGEIRLLLSGGVRPYRIRWDNGRPDTVRTNLLPGNYSYTVSDAAGCSYQAEIQILPAPNILLGDTILQPTCITEPLGEIRLFLDQSYGPYNIIWTGPSGFDNNRFNGITRLGPGRFEVFIRDQRNCFFTKQYQVNKLDTLTYTINATDVTCAGKEDGQIVFDIEKSNGVVFYSFDSLDWQTSPLFRRLTPGAYQIFLKDEAHCSSQEIINIQSPDSLSVSLGADTILEYGENIFLKPVIINSQGNTTYEWVTSNPLADFCLTCLEQTLVPLQSVDVKLSVVDEKGCRSEDVLRIAVKDEIILAVPTHFSPEGNGANDVLLVHGKAGISIQDFRIFDTHGNLLFQQQEFHPNDPVGWDGTFLGQGMPSGIYIWSLKAVSRSGQIYESKGHVQLVR